MTPARTRLGLERTDHLMLGAAVGAMAGGAWLGVPCALHSVTGHHCALCGGTRAFRSLVDGDILSALRMNAPATGALLLAVAAVATVVTMPRVGTRVDAVVARVLDHGPTKIVAALLLWTMARNLPGAELLRPPS